MDLRKTKTLIHLVSESNVSEPEITEAEGAHCERWSDCTRDVRSGQCAVAAAAPAAAPAVVVDPGNGSRGR